MKVGELRMYDTDLDVGVLYVICKVTNKRVTARSATQDIEWNEVLAYLAVQEDPLVTEPEEWK